ncbi:response regulator transcription factor [Wenzhouxiangella sp. EGI_FJ10305]|uniref:response regulator transcription factor n=1 Tax=Wenzhouxiangella sp. EGI_FJ10305 TaxID=3243768 RepID=UPI0035E27C39
MHDSAIQVSILINSEIFARGLQQALTEIGRKDVRVQLQTVEQAIESIARGCINILVLDVELAPQIVPTLSQGCHKPKLIMVSERRHAGATLPFKRNDACGFFPARAPESRLKYYLSLMVDCERRGLGADACQDCPVPKSLKPRNLLLSRRESEIFKLLGLLHSNQEIAERLSVSTKTVETHCANIKRKLNLENSRELLQSAIEWVEGR